MHNKVTLWTFYFSKMKNAEARHEFLEDAHVVDNFIVGDNMQNLKDYLLALIVEDVKLFVAVEQGSGKMSDSLIVIVVPTEKLGTKKRMSTVCRKEVTVKDNIECLTTFAPHNFPVKIVWIDDLENFLAQ